MPRRFQDARRHTETLSFVSVIVHASRIFREGLTSILAKSPFEPACAAPSLEDVPDTISGTDEQLMILLGVHEGSNLAEALSRTKGRFPAAHVVVIGDATKLGNVMTALESGATTFVDENTATSSLVKELELVALGEPVISVFILEELLGNGSGFACEETPSTAAIIDEPQSPDIQGQAEPTVQLSSREAAILTHLILGIPNKVIAHKLRITEATVKVHVKGILRKIRVKNRTQAAIWAMNHQVLSRAFGKTSYPVRERSMELPGV
jgi:two-component system nitrate/nitrite response regulator NarL